MYQISIFFPHFSNIVLWALAICEGTIPICRYRFLWMWKDLKGLHECNQKCLLVMSVRFFSLHIRTCLDTLLVASGMCLQLFRLRIDTHIKSLDAEPADEKATLNLDFHHFILSAVFNYSHVSNFIHILFVWSSLCAVTLLQFHRSPAGEGNFRCCFCRAGPGPGLSYCN